MVVRFHTFEAYHAKRGVGSTRIRVHNLLPHWPEAGLYKFGEKADVLIFQKVYCTYDYKLPANYPGITILDTCDPDWWETPNIYICETVRAVDAVVVQSQKMFDFISQMTNKPVKIIKDRFNIEDFPEKKKHAGPIKTAVWFGYYHNAELLKYAVPSLEARGIDLIVVADRDPFASTWAHDSKAYEKKYKFIKFQQETLYSDIQKADICVLPKGFRPQDEFKSENKTIIAQLCGLPVINNSDQVEGFMDPDKRNQHIDSIYGKIKADYDCRNSVKEYKELINNLNED